MDCRALGGPGPGCDSGLRTLHSERAPSLFDLPYGGDVRRPGCAGFGRCVVISHAVVHEGTEPAVALSLRLHGGPTGVGWTGREILSSIIVFRGNCGVCLGRCLPGFAEAYLWQSQFIG